MLTSSNKSKNTYIVEYGVLVGWMINHAVSGGESEDDDRNKTKKITKTTIKQMLSSAYCCGSPWLSGAVTVMVDAVVDVLCASRCVVCVLLLAVCERGTYLGVCRPFLWSNSVVRFCEQILSTKTFQVLLTSHMQNQHAYARWGLINAHALA